MAALIGSGTWVEVAQTALAAGERAPNVPADTQSVPLELRVRGFLAAAARVGEEAEILTASGRRLRGVLVAANPAYEHGFGTPIAELSAVGGEVRALLRQGRGGP